MSREAYEISEEAERDEVWRRRSDYLSILSEDYYYATHPETAQYQAMTEAERKRIIEEYKRNIYHG